MIAPTRHRPGFEARRSFRIALALLVGLAAAISPSRAEPVDGETLEVRGVVTDAQGAPVAGLAIALIAEPARLDWHRLLRKLKAPQTVRGTSDERGEFRLLWSGDAALPKVRVEARHAGSDESRPALAVVDITQRLSGNGPGVPLVVALAIPQPTAELEGGGDPFLATLLTDSERATYRELGRPERLERLEGAGWTESAWWYFELGKVVRFRDGARVETQSFPPVRPF